MSQQELRIAIPPGPTGLDAEARGLNGLLHRLLYARLMRYPLVSGPTGELIPDPPRLEAELAEGWESLDGGRRYRVRLRRGVHSPAGNELTGEDVIWSWRRAIALRDVGKWVARIGSIWGPEAVSATGTYEVEFCPRAANPSLLQQLTRATPTIVDSIEARRHATEDDPWASGWLGRNAAGFGTYRLESLDPWGEAVLVANPGAVGPSAFERVRVRFVPGARARRELLLAGEVDLLPHIDPWERALFEGTPGVRVSHAPSGAHLMMMMNCRRPPFDRREVRQAVAYAVPYERILDEVYCGTAEPWHGPLANTTPMASEAGWPYRHDPARARGLLAEAGLGGGFASAIFFDANAETHRRAARLVGEALAEVGIDLALEPMDGGTFWAGARYQRAYPVLLYESMHQVPDPYYALVHDYYPGPMGLINCGQYENAEVTRLVDAIEGEPDAEARRALVRSAEDLIVDDAPNAQLAQPGFLAALRDDLEGFSWAPDGHPRAEALSRRGT
ncbi:MAG: ABC transporter substrate-binding protein [Chloroflexi bacterium]|nr:ABC transporter substrate-binding protein [Chloroflexota bacterium]